MSTPSNNVRRNQRRRTRKDLLIAATKLLRDGQTPNMEDVAEAALVSRATAYRYFPNIEALLLEAPLDSAAPTPADLFSDDHSIDPEERLDRAEAALHEMTYRNESQLRLMIANSINAKRNRPTADVIPIRQNRRSPLIEAALTPVKQQLDDEIYEKLCAALTLIFGPEAMIVFQDVLSIDSQTAREVKSWALRTLVRGALAESGMNINKESPDSKNKSSPV